MTRADRTAVLLPLDDPRWEAMVAEHPDAMVFHTSGWLRAITECYRFDSFVLAVEQAGRLLAAMPVVAVALPFRQRRWVCLPFSDACPPLLAEGVGFDDVTGPLAHVLRDRGLADIELRWPLDPGAHRHMEPVGYRHLVPLDLPDGIRIRKNHRNTRNRAQRLGIEVTRGTSREDVEAYYRLHTLARRRLGVPVQPRRFFEALHKNLVSRGGGFVATAVLEDEVLAAGLYLGHNGHLMAKYGAMTDEGKRTGAGYLLDWDVMSAAREDGYRSLDFGRTDEDAEGLRHYKTGWGGVEEPLHYTHFAPQAASLGRPRSDGLARTVIQSSPAWVCRLAGEALYRWTA